MNKKIFMIIVSIVIILLFAGVLGFVFWGEQSGELNEPSLLEQTQTAPATEKQSETTADVSTTKKQQPNSNGKIVNASNYFTGVTTSKIFNDELQIYLTCQTEFQKNKIILTAEKIGNKYVSGKAESKCAFRYGEFSFKINILEGKGYFPAIWLMPQNGDPLPETDIFELVGKDPNRIYGVVHYIENGIQDKHSFITNINSKKDKSIVIDFKWTPNKMSWKINGNTEHVLEKNVPQVPIYMILNLAIGGNWPGSPDENTQFPAQFNIEILKFNPAEVYLRES